MATVNRPPFWVPRPPDDNIWSLQLQRAGALTLATTELNWFGAPGQVPTKRWLPHLLYDDPGVAYYPRIEWMNSAVLQILTKQKFFGAGGQAPTKQWSQQLTYDDPPPWQFPANWMDSAAIELLTHQQFFGAGGQVPTKLWSPYLWDDPSPVWQFQTDWMNSAAIEQLTSQKIFGQGGQVPPARWKFNYDETGPWQWTLQERNRNLVSTTQNPFVPVPWRFNYDETPPWDATPVAANIGFIPTNVPRSAFYALKPGDEHFWQPAVQRNVNLYPAAAAAQNPFSRVPWRFNYDEPPGWIGKAVPTNVNFIPLLIPSFALWIIDVDDPPTWQWALHRNLNINTGTATAAPGVPRIWTFRTDPDDVGWIGQPIATNINFVPTNIPRAPFYALRSVDEQVWVAAPRGISLAQIPTPSPAPVRPQIWLFDAYLDDVGWVGSSSGAGSSVLYRVTVFHPFWAIPFNRTTGGSSS